MASVDRLLTFAGASSIRTVRFCHALWLLVSLSRTCALAPWKRAPRCTTPERWIRPTTRRAGGLLHFSGWVVQGNSSRTKSRKKGRFETLLGQISVALFVRRVAISDRPGRNVAPTSRKRPDHSVTSGEIVDKSFQEAGSPESGLTFGVVHEARLCQACRLFLPAEPDLRSGSMEKGSLLHNARTVDHANDSEEPEVWSTSRAGSFKEIHPASKSRKEGRFVTLCDEIPSALLLGRVAQGCAESVIERSVAPAEARANIDRSAQEFRVNAPVNSARLWS